MTEFRTRNYKQLNTVADEQNLQNATCLLSATSATEVTAAQTATQTNLHVGQPIKSGILPPIMLVLSFLLRLGLVLSFLLRLGLRLEVREVV